MNRISLRKAAVSGAAVFLLWTISAPAAASTCRLEEGTALFESRKFADARRVLEPCAATDAKAGIYVGRAWIADGDFEKAVPALEKAVFPDAKAVAQAIRDLLAE